MLFLSIVQLLRFVRLLFTAAKEENKVKEADNAVMAAKDALTTAKKANAKARDELKKKMDDIDLKVAAETSQKELKSAEAVLKQKTKKRKKGDLAKFFKNPTDAQLNILHECAIQQLGHPPSHHWGRRRIPWKPPSS